MTRGEGFIVGGVVLGGGLLLYLMSSQKRATLTGNNALASAGGFLSGLGAIGASLSKAFSGPSSGSPPASYSSTSSPNSNGGLFSSYSPTQQTAVSNALADATAASDDATGVVGFGGDWGD